MQRRFPLLLLALLCASVMAAPSGGRGETPTPAPPPAVALPPTPAAPPNGEVDPIDLRHADYHGTRDVSTNADGFRDAEPPSPRQPGELRILCLGDSQTFGAVLPSSETWPRRLEEALAGRGRVTVVNAGRPGFDARRGAELLDQVVDRYDPQIVVADFGYNDAHIPAPEGRWAVVSAAHMTHMADVMKRRGGHFVYVAQAIRESSPQVSADQRAQLAQAYREAAAAAGCPVVVADDVLRTLPEAARYADQRDVHLSAQASRTLAEALAATIRAARWPSP